MDRKYILEQITKFLDGEDIGEISIERKPNQDIRIKRNTSEIIRYTKEMNKNKN